VIREESSKRSGKWRAIHSLLIKPIEVLHRIPWL
jgi:hypothetical protein